MGRHGFRKKNGNLLKDFKKKKYFQKEVAALKLFKNHPFFSQMVETFQKETVNGRFQGTLTMKFIDGCDLHTWITSYEDHGNVYLTRYVFKYTLLAYDYAIKNSIFHRDIKPENIMIDSNGVVKLIDWELASFKRFGSAKVGTVEYMAEEVFHNRIYDCEKSDVWSLAITMFSLYFGRRPYQTIECTQVDFDVAIYDEWLDLIFANQWYSFWKKIRKENKNVIISCQFKKIIESMMKKSPSKRSSIEELIIHDFFIEPCIEKHILQEKIVDIDNKLL